MLKLRRGVVAESDPLVVEVGTGRGTERRRAWADPDLVGSCEPGDEVVVNVAALDLGLGSGGFDIVHVNLTRGLGGGETAEGIHVMKLNYSSLQHAVDGVEEPADAPAQAVRAIPVLVLPLHGHLAPAAWAFARAAAEQRATSPASPSVGYVQTPGAALPGSFSRDVRTLRESGLLCGHVTAGSTYGGEYEAISVTGALHAAAGSLGWDAVIAGPGPGIIGSASRYGHGGMAALDSAHAALALELPTLISPRLSSGDPRPRHRGLSHHTETVLDLLLAPVDVALPGERGDGSDPVSAEGRGELARACAEAGHRLLPGIADLAGYRDAGLPRSSMGRHIDEDPAFFAAPLAAGSALAGLVGGD